MAAEKAALFLLRSRGGKFSEQHEKPVFQRAFFMLRLNGDQTADLFFFGNIFPTVENQDFQPLKRNCLPGQEPHY
ncbi:MAG: hypothetical protein IJD85_05255 [Oscillospiraceae bacterium]|nr:hypothetical protein [Oscillospiraceae bacterium]